MCGIAGFHVNPEFCADRITVDMMGELLTTAWQYNLHRGVDAAGYFRTTLEDPRVFIFKDGRAADDILDDPSFPLADLTPSTVMGAHTRAGTQGSARNNDNNHPVTVNGVAATHNGHINNHVHLKNQIKGVLPSDEEIPEVDSAAIPLVLSLADPFDLQKVCDQLDRLSGGFASHAIWIGQPNVSLLVRGKTSPLIVRYKEGIGVVYASEEQATFEMLEVMGENNADWGSYRMDEHTAILIQNGEPVAQRAFPSVTWSSSMAERPLVRHTIVEGVVTPAYVADKKANWCIDNGSPSARLAASEVIDLKYGRDLGISDDKLKLPLNIDEKLSRLVDADTVVWNKVHKTYHAFYGEIEVVMAEYGSLLDVFNHEIMKPEDRFVEMEPAKAPENVEFYNMDDFLMHRATKIMKPVDKHAEPQARRNTHPKGVALGAGGGTKTGKTTNTSAKTGQVAKTYSLFPGNGKRNQERRNQADRKAWWQWDMHPKRDFVWVHDKLCSEHGFLYAEHQNPELCGEAMIACLIAFGQVDELNAFRWLTEGTKLAISPSNRPCERECQIADIYGYRSIQIAAQDWVALPIVEKCLACGSKVLVKEFPEWVEEYDYTKLPELAKQEGADAYERSLN